MTMTPGSGGVPAPDQTVWRYMDLLELLAMLESSSIHFTRVDMLVDPLEGTYLQSRCRTADAMQRGDLELLERFALLEERYRRAVAVSCWYENDRESALMWKLYAGDHGVAVRTTYRRLCNAFDVGHADGVGLTVSRVRYVDGSDDVVPDADALWPFLHKWHHYSDEREVRVLHVDEHSASSGAALSSEGVVVPVSLEALIDNVVVSPFMPEWAQRPIWRLLERTAAAGRIRSSTLPASARTPAANAQWRAQAG